MFLASIILPTRNESQCIAHCLDSIFAQDFPMEQVEVLAIDGMSTDGTRDILEQYAKEHPSLRVLDNQKKIVTTAVNIGFANARAAVILRMDAHARYPRDYIRTCLDAMDRTGAANVGGVITPLPGSGTLMAHAIALAHRSPFALGGAGFRTATAEGEVETVWPGCFRKEVLDKVGYLREELTRSEDIDLNSRIRAAGYRIFLTPAIVVQYICRATLAKVWHQRWLDGVGVVHTIPVNRSAVRLRHMAPLAAGIAGFGLLITAVILTPANPAGLISALILAALAGMYLLLSIAFSLQSGISASRSATAKLDLPADHIINPVSALFLPVVFATLHLSYGLGSLWGLLTLPVRKSNRKG